MIIMLLLFAIHVGVVNYVHGMIAFGMFINAIWQPYKTGKLYANAFGSFEIWLLILFGLTYVLFGDRSLLYFEYYLIAPILAFLAGWIYCESTNDARKAVYTVITAILLGYGVRIALNVSINIGNTRLEMRDFFQGVRIATGSGALNTMSISLAMYTFFIAKGSERIRLLILLGLSCIYCLMLGTRTQIVILVIVFVSMLGTYMFEKDGWKGVIITVGWMLALIGILWVIYALDVFGIGSMINRSNLMKRFMINEYTRVAEASTSLSNRMELLTRSFRDIAEHPFGGNIDATYYHNFLLDIARISGIIPMFLMSLYLIKIFGNLLKVFRCKSEIKLRYMILPTYIGFWLNFAVEPVLEGLIEHFLMMCMFDGMITYIARRDVPNMLAR